MVALEALVTTSLFAAGVGFLIILVVNRINSSLSLTLSLVGAGIIGGYYYTAFWAILVVAFAPLWVGLIFAIAFRILKKPFVRHGYLGNLQKWHDEIEGDERFSAAILLLSVEEIRDVAQVSVDADDYRQNIIRAAGLDGYEAPGLD